MSGLADRLRRALCTALGAVLLALAPAIAASADNAATSQGQVAALEDASRAHPIEAIARLGALARTLAPGDRQRVLALGLRGALQAARQDSAGAAQTLQELDRLAPADAEAAAAAGWVRGAIAAQQGPLRLADRLLGAALERLPADASPLLRLRLLSSQARARQDLGQLDEAVRLWQMAIELAEPLGQEWRRSELRGSLAYTLTLARQFDRARVLADDALARARKAGDAVAQARALTTQAILYGATDDDAGELRAMNEAIVQARRAGARDDEVLGLANLADYYLKREDFATALRLSRQALPLARELKDPVSESVALANSGLALISLHRLAEGLADAQRSMAIEQRAGALTNMAALEAELARYLERAGYLREAVAANHRLRTLADAAQRQQQQQAIDELQERFDSERRQRELDLLRRDSELTQAQLATQTLQQRVWLVAASGAVLGLAVAGVLLMRLRQRHTALAAGNAVLLSQGECDPLTGLANRRHLQRRMQAAGDAVAPAFEGALLLVDLDHFKRVNDCHGHATGDAALVEVARRLLSVLRADDLTVRWGGEEFLVVTRGLDQLALETLAQRLLDAIGATPLVLAGQAITLTASIGFASFPTAPTRLAVTWERALDLVDTALYLAKSHGRNRAYGVRRLQAESEAQLTLVSRSLERASSSGQIELAALRGPAHGLTAVAA